MYKQVFPHGLGSYGTPAHTPTVSRQASTVGLASASAPTSGTGTPFLTPGSGTSSAASSIVNGKTGHTAPVPIIKTAGGLFGRLTGKSAAPQPAASSSSSPGDNGLIVPNGSVEELIVAGAAFGIYLVSMC